MLAEPIASDLWATSPPLSLGIIDRRRVRGVVKKWPAPQLDWDEAVRRCGGYHRSCFVGVRVKGAVCILALIHVSRSGLHTSLLYLEKYRGAVPPGIALAIMEIALQAIAATFSSEKIVVDNPLPGLVAYYTRFGYRPMKQQGRHSAAMFKATWHSSKLGASRE